LFTTVQCGAVLGEGVWERIKSFDQYLTPAPPPWETINIILVVEANDSLLLALRLRRSAAVVHQGQVVLEHLVDRRVERLGHADVVQRRHLEVGLR
jgi:hypothetical protein